MRGRVNSPTFVLVKRYKLKTSSRGGSASGGKNYKLAFHIDCYRIKKPKELLNLGLREILADPKNMVLIEWAGTVAKYLSHPLTIYFKPGISSGERILVMKTPR